VVGGETAGGHRRSPGPTQNLYPSATACASVEARMASTWNDCENSSHRRGTASAPWRAATSTTAKGRAVRVATVAGLRSSAEHGVRGEAEHYFTIQVHVQHGGCESTSE
jgi:hypothetical protein